MNKGYLRKQDIFPIIIISLIIIFTFFSCTNNKQEEPASKIPKEHRIEIELLNLKHEDAVIMNELIDEYKNFNPNTNIRLTIRSDAEASLKRGILRQEIPDLLAIRGTSLVTELSESGLIMDLTETGLSENIDLEYLNIAKMLNTESEQRLFGIPYVMKTNGIIYNKKLFNEMELKIPVDWDSFLATCTLLKNEGVVPLVFPLFEHWAVKQSWQALVNTIDDDFINKKKIGISSFVNSHEEILKKYLQILPFVNDDYMVTSFNDGINKMAHEEVAMIIMGGWAIFEILEINPAISLGVMPFPNDTQVVNLGVDVMLMVSENSEYKNEVVNFIKYLLQKDVAQKYADTQYAFSAVSGVKQNNTIFELISEQLLSGNTHPFSESYYPDDFDYSIIISEFLINHAKGMESDENIHRTLTKLDEHFDAIK